VGTGKICIDNKKYPSVRIFIERCTQGVGAEENAMRNALRYTVGPWVLGALLLTLATGCGSDNPAQPLLQPEVNNITDTFQFQATTNGTVTQNFEYTWQNTGTSANVDQSTVLNSGAATVTILDADGMQVYSRDMNEDGTFQTGTGTTGNWTIRVALVNAVGGLNFRCEKP
jgi:hypothetical protein